MTRVGWCPGGRTVGAMFDLYPNTTAVRVFVGAGKALPTWDGPVLGPIPPDVLLHLSFKTFDLPAVERWLAAMPAEHAPIILTYAHEPEQGTTAGDPTVEVFRTRWAELVAALADHPRRADVLLVPVYTRYWWQKNAGDMRWMLPGLGLDAIGWDVYNDRTTGYRTPDDLLSIPRDIAARTGLPYLIAELGAVRVAGDKDGTGRARWMRDMVAAAGADGAWTVCWFHKDEWNLAPELTAATAAQDPATERQTWRELTQEVAVAWSKGQNWRVVRSLERLLEQIRAAYPKAVPPATPASSWGAIADSAHSSTSDHYPHFYSALGKTAVVCARDFPHAPALGLDAHALAEQLRQSRDSRIGYVISNGRITGPSRGWQWGTYSGSDPHDTHIHVSTVHTAVADDERDWQIGDDDMPTADEIVAALLGADLNYTGSGSKNLPLRTLLRNLHQQQHGPSFADWQATKDTTAIKGQLTALTTATGKLPALIGAESTSPAELTAALDQLAGAVTDRVLAALPDGGAGPIDRAELESAVVAGVRSALGSLDEAPQSAPE